MGHGWHCCYVDVWIVFVIVGFFLNESASRQSEVNRIEAIYNYTGIPVHSNLHYSAELVGI